MTTTTKLQPGDRVSVAHNVVGVTAPPIIGEVVYDSRCPQQWVRVLPDNGRESFRFPVSTVTRLEGSMFEDWLRKVDAHLGAVAGLSHRDIADQTWRDWYDDEMEPGEAAELALEDEGFPF